MPKPQRALQTSKVLGLGKHWDLLGVHFLSNSVSWFRYYQMLLTDLVKLMDIFVGSPKKNLLPLFQESILPVVIKIVLGRPVLILIWGEDVSVSESENVAQQVLFELDLLGK